VLVLVSRMVFKSNNNKFINVCVSRKCSKVYRNNNLTGKIKLIKYEICEI